MMRRRSCTGPARPRLVHRAARRARAHARWRGRAGVALGLVGAACVAWPGGAGAQLPARAYELVSPVDKNGGEVYRFSADRATADGNALQYLTNAAIPGAEASPIGNVNIARRTDAGWVSTAITPAATETAPPFWDQLTTLSPDLSQALLMSRMPLTAGAPPVPNLYLRDRGGALTLLTATRPTGLPPFAYFPYVVGASPGFERVVFFAPASLTDDTPGSDVAGGNLYEWRGGEIRPVGVLPDGRIAAGSAAGADSWTLGATRPGAALGGTVAGAVSADASRVFFHAPLPPSGGVGARLYVKIDGRPTQEVSAPQPGVSDPAGPQTPLFEGAARDGSVAYFRSCERLTADALAHGGASLNGCGETDASNDLYRYEVDADRLTDVTPVADARVRGVMAVSDDGETVYFVADGALAPGATAGESNLYHWRDGRTTFIAPITLPRRGRTLHATPDGRHVAFETSATLPGFDNRDAGGTPRTQIYRWTVGDGAPTCLSCRSDGRPPIGDASFQSSGYGASGDPSHAARAITDDGRRVVFASPDPLVPGADNGHAKVYVHEGGQVGLISTGTSPTDDYVHEMSADGRDIFFATTQPLSPADGDDSYDIYDARIGGGFPVDGRRDPCPPADCRGAPTPPPAQPVPGSAVFSGPGDLADADVVRAAVFAVRPLTAAQRRQLARRGRVVLRVRVSEPGAVEARVRARIGRRAALVARARRVARRGGTVRLPLRLAPRARAHLRRHGRLRIAIAVRFAAAEDGPRRVRLTLVREDPARRRTGPRRRGAPGRTTEGRDAR